jgi:hypothetical protein
MFGLIALIIGVVVGTLPVWIAAKVAQAGHPTFLRSLLSLIAGAFLSAVGGAIFGVHGIYFIPFAYLLAFKYILDISFIGAILLAIIALAGYFALGHLMPHPVVLSTS